MTSTAKRTSTLLCALVLWVGCDSDPATGTDAGSTGEDLTLETPATAMLRSDFGGPPSATLCQNLAFGGGIGYSLGSGTSCLGGEVYLSFVTDSSRPDSMVIQSGTVLTESFDGPPIRIESVSVGTLMPGEPDTVRDVPMDTEVTIATSEHATVTFRVASDEVVVTVFE